MISNAKNLATCAVRTSPDMIESPVDVGAVFGKKEIKIKWFVLNGRKFDIKEITYTWKDKCGDAEITHFTASDGTNLFELSFNHKTLKWVLEKSQ